MRALIDDAKYYNKNLYLFYGDLEKCFDKLWLRDCIVEAWKAGVPANEAMIIFEMNKEAKIVVDTPHGRTAEITTKEIVRQGTIWGPTLCAVSTEKVNKVGEKVSTLYSNLNVESLTYVDDICGAGGRETVSKTIDNCARMEEKKRMTFNETKSNYQILEFGEKRDRVEIKKRVKKGPIIKTDKYKYLGDYVNNKGTYKDTIQNKEKKIYGITKAIIKDADCTGESYGKVVNKLYLTKALPYVTSNMETWSAISKSEMASIEKMQKDMLLRIYGMPKTTPYEPFLSELGIWPIRHYINYKKLLLLHNLINSPDERVAAKILKAQMENQIRNCWYSELKERCDQYEIDTTSVKDISKNEWKKRIRKAITKSIENEEWTKRTKSRNSKGFERKKYLDETDKATMRNILSMKVNMIEVKMNYKGKYRDIKCPICKTEDDTTEHSFECNDLKDKVGEESTSVSKEDITSENVVKLKMLEKYIKKALKIREIYL
ncbi:uncharacterized protein [Clytia hemisphaerica]|uniref:uncharacterized protein n=1 Tax=Clytia hemisphaerica TaxID=252671 RepID=UPI0034D748F7